MATLALVLLASTLQADVPLNRFESYMKSARSLQVKVSVVASNSKIPAQGTFYAKRPDSVAFVLKMGKYSYRFVANEDVMYEQEDSAKRYEWHQRVGDASFPPAVVTSIPEDTFPYFFVHGSLRKVIPANKRYTLQGNETVSGVSCDLLEAKFPTTDGTVTVRAWIAGDGRLLKQSSTLSTGPEVGPTITKTFTDFRKNQPIPAAIFDVTLPVGYAPDSISNSPRNVEPGYKLPLGKWKSANGQVVDLAVKLSGHPALLFVSSPDCLISPKWYADLPGLASKIQSKSGNAYMLSTSGVIKGAPITSLIPATEKAARQLYVPGTPFIYLLSSDGRVSNVWMGYDLRVQGEVLKEMQDAIQAIK